MSLRRATIAAFFLLVAVPVGFCCSCSNNIPVQQSLERYRDRAVFKAHILGWLGSADSNGHRVSDRALAIVRELYWGLPLYWPSIVVVESPGLCGMVVQIGEDYFISGWRVGYGTIEIGECSRTQLFESAQVDLRTMDGTHCSTPGGTVLGHIYRRSGDASRSLAPNSAVSFSDETGKRYETRSDRNGVYELSHLPPGLYTAEDPVAENSYASAPYVNVEPGLCIDVPVRMEDYSVRGSLLPGLDTTVELIGLNPGYEPVRAAVEPNGKFYFRNPPDGEYVLSVSAWVDASKDQMYFPGVTDRQKAARVEIKNHLLTDRRNLDFDPSRLPMVNIPVVIDPPLDSRKYSWRIQLLHDSRVQNEARGSGRGPRGLSSLLYGTRGTTYEVVLFGYSNQPTEYEDCRSESVTVVAQASMSPAKIKVPPDCL